MEIPNIPPESYFADTKQIAIVGAGPTGLAALKTIQDSPEYKAGLWKPVAFEAKGGVGGVWLPSPGFDDPLYDSLTTNLPHPIMAFSDFSFPPSTPLFPEASVVRTYLEAYAESFELFVNIRLNTPVIDANWNPTQSKWNLQVRPPNSSTLESFAADILFVCNGHYNVPRYPDVPGLLTWLNPADPPHRPLASHSMFYRHPSPEYGETVLVIGGGPSGKDMVSDLLTSPLIKSVIHSTTMSTLKPKDTGKLVVKPRPSQFLPPTSTKGTVSFVDGTREHNITHCLLATGYEVSFPFFPLSPKSPTQPNLMVTGLPPPPPPLPTSSGRLWNTTYSVFPLARHLFPFPASSPTSSSSYKPKLPVNSPTPTLFFIALPMRVVPFPFAESQTRAALAIFRSPTAIDWVEEGLDVVARWEELKQKYANHLAEVNIPASTHTRQEDTAEREEEETKFIIKKWHRFEPMEQFSYRDSLDALADYLTDSAGGSSYENKRPAAPRVKQWERTVYNRREILRRTWCSLEASGEAEAWVKGVGEGGNGDEVDEWVDLMDRLFELGEKMEGGEGKAKL